MFSSKGIKPVDEAMGTGLQRTLKPGWLLFVTDIRCGGQSVGMASPSVGFDAVKMILLFWGSRLAFCIIPLVCMAAEFSGLALLI